MFLFLKDRNTQDWGYLVDCKHTVNLVRSRHTVSLSGFSTLRSTSSMESSGASAPVST